MNEQDSQFSDEFYSEGMMEQYGKWIPIECAVQSNKETAKAYYGTITVFKCDEYGRALELFTKDSWIPKSMAENPWWIVTVLFKEDCKVSNRRFDEL